ncbi:hypothetical protein OAI07_01370 [Akkermansiaceae bacterium]|nr:hypothetical protein [Akkermansiaceae bacterium]
MAIGAGIALTGVLGAVSKYQQGKAEQANHEYNAQVSENQAQQVQLEAEENARREWKNNEQQLSSARAQLANQGAVSSSGAPLSVLGDISGQLELNIQDGYRQASIQRQSLYQDAKISRVQGDNAASAGKLMAFSSLIGTGTQAFGNFKTGTSSGLFGGGSSNGSALSLSSKTPSATPIYNAK